MRFRIPNPCGEDWSAMEIRGHGRLCASCDHIVVDLGRMTREKAEAFVRSRAGRRICARLLVDRETGEAWFPPSEARAPHWRGGLVLAAALTGAGCAGAEGPRETEVAVSDVPPPEPMAPLDPTSLATVEPPYTGPVPAAELNAPPPGDVEPTAEQRRLTARKHFHGHGVAGVSSPTPPAHPPYVLEMLGDPVW